MTSRERVLASLEHKQPDQIPVDFNGHSSSGISVQAYRRLREYLGLPQSPLYIYDVIQQLAIVEDDVLDLLGIDVFQLGCEYSRRPDYWQDWELHDGTRCKIPKHIPIHINPNGDYEIYSPKGTLLGVQKKGCLYFEQCYFPFADSERDRFDDLSEYMSEFLWGYVTKPPAPTGLDAEGLKQRAQEAAQLRGSTTRAIYANFGGKFFEPSTYLYRMDNLMMNLALEPDAMHRLYDALLSLHLNALSLYLKAVGPYIDVLGIVGDDLGMQTGPLLSADMFREFLKPRYKAMVDFVKQNYPHIKICMHSCGSIVQFLPDLIDLGIGAVNPVQISCKGMDPKTLKQKFGDSITFWGGGCDTGYYLTQGTPEEIRRHVEENIRTFSPGGGFVFQQVHNILANVPPQNIMAMMEAVNKFRA